MSNFTKLNEIFHIFSKTPVADGQTLASARNKSGHTVTTSDIWAEDIPAFFSAPTQSHITNLKNIAKDNDLCYDETNKSILYFKNDEWIQRDNLKNGELLANYEASKIGIFNDGSLKDESKAVVKYYLDQDAIAIDGDNNNTADGNRYTARIAKDNNSFVQQFVSSMDKIVNSNPSTYYEPVVNGGNITEDIADKGSTTKYIANNYAGIIQFHEQMVKQDGKLKDITISAFEYIGKTLTDVLKDFETLGSLEDVGISYKVLDSLPNLSSEQDKGSSYNGVVALIPEKDGDYPNKNDAISGSYIEYLCVASTVDGNTTYSWEKIGTTQADLTQYSRGINVNGQDRSTKTSEGYTILGSLVEDVIYNSLAGTYAVVDGNTKKYQNFNVSNIPNYDSVTVGISSNGYIAVGIETATDEVYGLSKMFTSAIPSTPATNEADIIERKKTAVSVQSTSEMYNSLASAIAYTKTYVDGLVNDPTAYVFQDLSPEERKYYIIYDAWQNPTCFSEDFTNDLVDGYRLFDYRSWQHYHIDMPNLITQYRMFHSNNNLMSFKSDLSSLTNYEGMFHGDTNLEYIDIVLTTNTITETKDCFTSCDKLKYVKLTCSNIESINTILAKIPENSSVKNKRLSLGHLDDNGAFVLYDESLFNSEKIASLKAAGWKINN